MPPSFEYEDKKCILLQCYSYLIFPRSFDVCTLKLLILYTYILNDVIDMNPSTSVNVLSLTCNPSVEKISNLH